VRAILSTRLPTLSCFLLLLLHVAPLLSQASIPEPQHYDWDFGVWIAGATGEEKLNDFSEAQILTAGVFAGKVLTDEIGSGWRRGRFEYGVTVIPLFRQLRPEAIYGGGIEPVVLRWNSSLRTARVAPYIELAGGALRTDSNLPAGDTSNFNFTTRGGGGIRIFQNNRRWTEIGCRWMHISNANLGVKNPEFNGIQVSLGYHWAR
jgi:lipid A 3-O-deacylase